MNTAATPTNYKLRAAAFLLALVFITALADPAGATDRIKQNNTTALNLAGSWDTLPGSGDVGVWNSTVAGANASALGAGVVGGVSWQGIRIANPGGLATIGNTTTAAGGDLVSTTTDVLTLGTSGIDLSAATQNLLINGNMTIGGNQTWTVANGRTLQISTINTKARITGSGNISLVNASGTGTATFDLRPGDSGSIAFTDQNGYFGYSGTWTVGPNCLVKTLRNGANCWGSGTLILAGGTVAQQQNFSGTWNNPITLQTSTTSTIDDANSSGTRTLKLLSVISGSGNLNIAETGAASYSVDGGVIIAANNPSMSGAITINDANAVLRIGGVGTAADTTTGAGTAGTIGTANVVNNGTLTLSHSDAWTFANTVSGTGALRIGGAVSGASSQVVTISGNNTHSGATTVSVGKMIGVTGGSCGNSAVTVASGATLGVKLNSAGGTWSCTNLTLNSSSTTLEANFNNFTPSTTTAPLQVSNNVVNSGTLNVTILNGIFAATDYPLVKAVGGTVTAGTLGTVTMPGGAAASLTSDSTTIYLHVTTATPLTYYWGVGTGTWDTSTANWNTAADGTTVASYANGFPAIFNDTSSGTAPFTVTLNSTVTPTSVTVNNPTKNYTISGSGAIAGGIGLTKSGAGTLTLSTANSYSGATTVSGGTLSVGSDGNLGTAPGSATAGSLVLNGAALSASAGFTLAANRGLALGPTSGSGSGTIDVVASQTLAYAGIAANNGGTGSLAKTGAGTLALSGGNTYGGATTVSNGTLAISGGGAIPDGSTVSLSSGATFQVNASETIAGLNTVSGSTLNAASGTLTFTTGSILGNLTGAGTLLRNGTTDTAGGQFTNANALNFTGTLQLRGSTPSSSPSSMQGATGRFWLHDPNGSQAVSTAFALDTGASGTDAQDLVYGDWDATSGNRKLTLSSLTGYGTFRVDAGNPGTRNVIVDQSGGDTTFNGMLLSHTSGSGQVRSLSFEKKGSSSLTMAGIIGKETAASGAANADVAITVSAGTLVLAANNTLTGPVTVNGGTLTLGASGSIANSPTITVASGAMFDVSAVSGGYALAASQTLKGNGTVTGAATINGTVAPGLSIGTLTFSTAPTLSGTLLMELDRTNSQTADKIVGLGTLGGTLTATNIGQSLVVGDTFDLFDGTLAGSFSTLTLPFGTVHWITSDLAAGGTITFTNNNPLAHNIIVGVVYGGTVTLPVIGGKNGATDAEGDAVTLTSVGTASSGTASFSGSNVTYVASGSTGTNTFTYTVTDALGATDTKTVTVIVSDPQGFNQVSAGVDGGNAVLTYLGIPGTNYALEVTHDLPATNWTPVITNPASAIGYLYFTNPISLSPTNDYYRTHYVP